MGRMANGTCVHVETQKEIYMMRHEQASAIQTSCTHLMILSLLYAMRIVYNADICYLQIYSQAKEKEKKK